jgi:hypothetical protein
VFRQPLGGRLAGRVDLLIGKDGLLGLPWRTVRLAGPADPEVRGRRGGTLTVCLSLFRGEEI